MATIKERIDTVTDNVIGGKSDIASAITDIGVPATSAETFNSLANKIKQGQGTSNFVSTTFGTAIFLNRDDQNSGITGIRQMYKPPYLKYSFPVAKTEKEAFIVPEFNFAITNGHSFSDYQFEMQIDTMDFDESSVPSFLKIESTDVSLYISYDGSPIPDNKIYNVLVKPVIYYDDDFEKGRRWFYITFRSESLAPVETA